MNLTTPILPFPVALPLIVAACVAFTGKWIGRRACDVLAIATAVCNVLLTIAVLRGVWSQPQVYWFGNWWPRAGGVALGICFSIDAIGASLALLTSVLA